MGPGFESQRDHLMGQVAKIAACPIFFFPKRSVQRVYQPYGFVELRGSKILAVKRDFFGEHRTKHQVFLLRTSISIYFTYPKKIANTLLDEYVLPWLHEGVRSADR